MFEVVYQTTIFILIVPSNYINGVGMLILEFPKNVLFQLFSEYLFFEDIVVLEESISYLRNCQK